jgi:hypothetical protein
MTAHTLAARYGKTVTLDACYPCNALWFDTHESTSLSPDGVVELFQLVHQQGGATASKLTEGLACVRCKRTLATVQDRVQSTRFNYLNCGQGHGRLITFYQFLAEKQFVRELTPAERSKLAAEVKQVRCSGCGAAVDLTTQNACVYCRAPISVFDREAAKKAIDHYLKERGKQLPSNAPVIIERGPSTGHHGDYAYTAADLAADAVWAMAHFATRARPWAATGAVGGAVANAGAADLALPTVDSLMNGTPDAVNLFSTSVGDSLASGATSGLGADLLEGTGLADAGAAALESSSEFVTDIASDAGGSMLDLVGDGIGAFVSSIFD